MGHPSTSHHYLRALGKDGALSTCPKESRPATNHLQTQLALADLTGKGQEHGSRVLQTEAGWGDDRRAREQAALGPFPLPQSCSNAP